MEGCGLSLLSAREGKPVASLPANPVSKRPPLTKILPSPFFGVCASLYSFIGATTSSLKL
jgi:hypothetical protein